MTDILFASIPTDFAETLTITAERVALTVGTYSPNVGQRRAWHYYIAVDGNLVHGGNDLSGYENLEGMMETLTSFLSAWAESVEWSKRTGQTDSENGHLFPTSLYPLIGSEIDDLTSLTCTE